MGDVVILPVVVSASDNGQRAPFEELLPKQGSLIAFPSRVGFVDDALYIKNLFSYAIRLEEVPETVNQAARLYEEIILLAPSYAAPSYINLGTIRYNEKNFQEAAGLYLRATESDPEYALAFFDLANTLDELQQLDEAIEAYERAIALVPHYANAHYNLALAYERTRQPSYALRHWRAYYVLDPSGPWSSYARKQAKKAIGSLRAERRLMLMA
jgi:tetratricopeptide (TPR) repeat protein